MNESSPAKDTVKTIPENVQIIEHNNYRWINIEQPDNAAIEYLQANFAFHALDYEDVVGTTHRSKIDKYPNYIFLILMFPAYNQKTKQVDVSEIDFFLGPDYLITIHRDDIPTFTDLYQLCEASDQACETLMGESPQYLLYKILQRLFQYCYPILDTVDAEIDQIENKIFATGGEKLLQDILYMRHSIIDLRKIMQPHEATLTRLIKPTADLPNHITFELEKEYDDYFDDLLDYTKEIWHQLESFKESVDALHETNESLISHRINDVMKTLTMFSVVMLPASVVAGIFGMNARFIPFADHGQGFWAMTALTFLAITLTLIYIRRRRMI